MKKILLLMLVLFCLPAFAFDFHFSYNSHDGFSFSDNNTFDFSKNRGWVMDRASILAQDELITERIIAIEKATTAEIAVVTVPSLNGRDMNMFSIGLADDLKVGKEDVDNGLIILIVPEDRQYRIEVGYGLEGLIPDAVAGRIGRDVFVPAFKAGDYDKGVLDAIAIIEGHLVGEEEVISKYRSSRGTSTRSGSQNVSWKTFLIVCIFMFIVFGFKGQRGFFPIFIPGGGFGGHHGGSGRFGSGGFGGFGGGGFGGGGAGGSW